MPPESWCGYSRDALLRLGDAARAAAARPRARARRAVDALVQHAAPRRSAGRCVSTGLSEVIGSWKIIEIALAADRGASRASSSASRSVPSRRTEPPTMRPGGSATRRMSDSAVTLLPQPDSPTIASVSPRPSANETPSTALTVPRARVEVASAESVAPRAAARWHQSRCARIERVAHRVAEEVGAEHHQADRDARERSPATARCARIRRRTPRACGPRTDAARGCPGRGTTAPTRPGWPSRPAPWRARSAAPACSAARGAMAMRNSLMPTARAASTKGISRSDSVLERMMRATLGTSGMAMAMMVLVSDGPSEAAITSAMTSSGSDCMMSISALHDEVEPAAEEAGQKADRDADQAAERGGANRRPPARCARRGRCG